MSYFFYMKQLGVTKWEEPTQHRELCGVLVTTAKDLYEL